MAGEEVHTVWDCAGLRSAAQREAEVGRQRGVGRRELDDVDKFAFVQSMGIDPIKESEMIWIAEEALVVQLPPNWTEQVDDRGRSFFFNTSSGASSWTHPMEDVFKDLVEYYRQVIEEGGFWMVEDQLSEYEEKIRAELADWQELFDERGQKFHYNRQTEESRLDDPRHSVYHCLYARIKMVAKMRERLPHLAAVPRPEDPEVIRARRREEKQQQAEERVSLRMQSVFRMMMARRKAQEIRKRRMMNLVPLPMQSELKLNLQRTGNGGKEDIVISLPSGRRRHVAVLKLQAFFRGCLARKRTRGMVRHRTMLRRRAKKIQLYYRLHMKDKWAARKLDSERTAASHTILQMVHSQRDRHTFQAVLDEHAQFLKHRLRCIVKIQSLLRGMRARTAFKRKLNMYGDAAKTVQSALRMHQARQDLALLYFQQEPAQLTFSPNGDENTAGFLPWSWNLLMVPVSGAKLLGKPHHMEDLFAKGSTGSPIILAAECIQKWARGKKGRRLARERDQFLRAEARRKAKEAARMPFSATEIQRRWRGHFVRHRDVLSERRAAIMAQRKAEIELTLAYIYKVKEQAALMFDLKMESANDSCIVIQTYWRRHKAKQVARQLKEESLWTLKGCFDFFATGTEAVQCSVNFIANPSFDNYKFFDERGTIGTGYALPELLDSMEDEVEACVARFLKAEALQEQERQERLARGEAVENGNWLDMLEPDPPAPSTPNEPSVQDEEEEEEEEPEPFPPTPPKKKQVEVRSPSGIERIHYAGAMIDGRFVKNKTTSTDQITEFDKQAIMADIQLDRERRIEELHAKQKRHAARILKMQREEARHMAETRQAMRPTKSLADLDPRLKATAMPPPRTALLEDMKDDPMFRRMAQGERMRQLRSGEVSPQRSLQTSPGSSPKSLPRLRRRRSADSVKEFHTHVHKHQEQVVWKGQAGGPSSPVSQMTALPSLTDSRRGAGAASSLGFGRRRLERSMSAGELTRPGGPGKGNVAAIRGVPMPTTQSCWSPSPLFSPVDSFADTVRQISVQGH